ncbi:uncharacterized protein LY89DRAFT_738496 [Mollisia scopiformis]|uniref:Glycosyl hydrolase family 92 N-terminal domain-containing protein n=1 Tax=Mollisia scopiformis TaxID=149040 RepID=A0A194WV52_MOLSC|nr:uncharacterized protein LY89DRAFT_738496 [Mollisia scopiformis]KUJ11851.1 hypothetical protein LY89DRAFT_738496 [Mollisia scopiformis]
MLLSLTILAALVRYAVAQVDYSQFVNPLIGSEGPISGYAFGGGDIFVGGAVPFGLAKVGIDTYKDNITLSTLNGGYTPMGKATAFSMIHEYVSISIQILLFRLPALCGRDISRKLNSFYKLSFLMSENRRKVVSASQ